MLQSMFYRLLAFCSLYLRLFFLRILLFFSQVNPAYKSDTKRSILLIGDGTAEGIGDNVGKAGLSSRIGTLLSENDSLRFSWRVVSAGRLWTTAIDWHPTGGTLFQKTLSNRRFRDADIVLLTFGMHDDPATSPELVVAIAEALVRIGKHVVVAGLFNPHAPKTEQHAVFRNATQDMKQRLDLVEYRNRSPESASLAFGADPVKVCAMGADTLSEESGFYTFNSRGYRLFSSELLDDIVTAAKRVEWHYFKKRLTSSSS